MANRLISDVTAFEILGFLPCHLWVFMLPDAAEVLLSEVDWSTQAWH
jgi:hypothetical protein